MNLVKITRLRNKGEKYKINMKVYKDIIDCMLIVLGYKDTYILDHSIRVGKMAYKLGGFLGMSENELEVVQLAGKLHDIGKIGIPDSILNKRGKLDRNEWDIMKKHSQIGCGILSNSKYLKCISYIVLNSHERWDGTGYPNGLSGEKIPFAARVISICDSVDAMKSKRIYKTLISDFECRKELIKNKGTMYDDIIVECMIRYWDEIVT